LAVQKKVVPLHPQSREMPFGKRGIFVQARAGKLAFMPSAAEKTEWIPKEYKRK
jgi:hypothetical protein